ncbi:factor activating pos9 [Coelomomyces lativittatus]|nr:factor activating pos9 [Coelomomyces lativittatus]KAJ1498149.1 factor activating pos9 [Coelomomyces lativittatus]KAJ1517124.1 factor activating pos9 [Coelomomyces lativittatus]
MTIQKIKHKRNSPNILVTGTPGTGKTTLCELLSLATSMKHLSVSEMVKHLGLHEGWDDQYECFIIDEDKICDQLQPEIDNGGCLVDFHSVDFFPEDWFDLIVVLHAQTHTLYDRLVARNYPEFKVKENVTAEIMHVIAEDVRESYPNQLLFELDSDTVEQMDSNTMKLIKWIEEKSIELSMNTI